MKLKIKNVKELSKVLYNDDLCIDDLEMAKDILKALTKNLENVYNFFDILDDDLSSTQIDSDDLKGIDLYQIGDVINLLEDLEIEED